MTPQLQQAIKMLQLSNLELADYVDAESEQNPLLERGENEGDDGAPAAQIDGDGNGAAPATEPSAFTEPATADFSTDAVEQWQTAAGADGDGSAEYSSGDFGDSQPWRTRNGGGDGDDFPGLDQAAARPRT